MVICREQSERRLQRPRDMAVEVFSPSTRELALSVRRELYCLHGVAYTSSRTRRPVGWTFPTPEQTLMSPQAR